MLKFIRNLDTIHTAHHSQEEISYEFPDISFRQARERHQSESQYPNGGVFFNVSDYRKNVGAVQSSWCGLLTA